MTPRGSGDGAPPPTTPGSMNLGNREAVTGFPLFQRHFRALLVKRFKNTQRDRAGWIWQFLVPAVFILAGVALLKVIGGTSDPGALAMSAASQYNTPLPIPYSAADSGYYWPPGSDVLPVAQFQSERVPIQSTSEPANTQLAQFPSLGVGRGSGSGAPTPPIPQVFDCNSIAGDFPFNENYQHDLFACTSATAQIYQTLEIASILHMRATNQSFSNATAQKASEMLGEQLKAQCKGAKEGASGRQDFNFAQVLSMGNYLFDKGLKNYATKETRYGALDFQQDAASGVDVVISINSTGYHAAPVFMNLVMQAVGSKLRPNLTITSTAEPFGLTDSQKANGSASFIVVALFLIIAFSIVPATFISFVVVENRTKAKHLQIVSGVSKWAYWISTFCFDFCSYCVPMILTWIILAAFNIEGLLGQNFAGTAVVFILFGTAVTPMTYAFSFLFDNEGKALIFCVIVYFIVGFLLFLIDILLGVIPSTANVDKSLRYIFALMPDYAFSRGLFAINQNDVLPDCPANTPEHLLQYCRKDVFAWDVAGMPCAYLFFETIAFFLLTIFIETSKQSQTGLLSWIFHRKVETEPDAPFEEDEDLVQERQRVASGEADGDIVRVQGLRKVYPGRGNVGKKVAVRDLTFGVPEGEVFGFLGINGAGKTTTLSILSGEFPPTKGDAHLAGLNIKDNRQEINQRMGYCPQFDALLGRLTGREHLEMYARIKGVSEHEIPAVVEDCIDKMNLREHCEREAGGYSGGNKRKLSVAIALVGNPSIVFLDEPSTGMDPEARRFMWNVIANTMAGRSVILTTHSMEEAEALSNRIGIMVGGRLRCLGSVQHLKDKYGAGYTLELRVDERQVGKVEGLILSTFDGAEETEKHIGQLRYSIPRSNLKLSQMFALLEESREQYGILDYALSQTTLEQVFINFAAQQEEETGPVEGIASSRPEATDGYSELPPQ